MQFRALLRPLHLRFILATALVPILLFITVSGCKRFGSGIAISSTNISEEIELAQNIVFRFNREVAPDNLIGAWDSLQYVNFQPHVPGRFKWTGRDELVFSPASSFAPSTDYKASLTEALSEVTPGQRQSVNTSDAITFHTPYLDIKGGEVFWSKDENSGVLQARINLRFNYPVAAQQVKNLTEISIQDQPRDFKLITAENAEEIKILVSEAALKGLDLEKDLQVDVVVAPGLECIPSKWATKEKLKFRTIFPAQGPLSIANVENNHDGTQGTIRVYTTKALPGTRLARFVSITPNVAYTVEARENGFEISGTFNPEEFYTLKISGELTDILGKRLGKDFEQSIAFKELGESIQFASERGSYLSSKGARTLAVKIINVPKVRVRISKVYENNLIAFMRQGSNSNYYYESDGEGEGGGSGYYDSYNTDDYGDVIHEKEYETKNLPKQNGTRLLELDFTDKRKDYKGIYVVEIQSKDKYYLRTSKLLALSDIGLIARHSGDELYVFANSLLNAEPLKGLKVNFVSSNNQNMYTGTTDANGVAVFKDIEKTAPGFRTALITAAQDDDLTYLSLQRSRVETSRFEVGGKPTRSRPYDAYLYGDRDMYRPGDSIFVNAIVRTWARRVEADMPIRLRLLLPNGREAAVQRGTLNEQGSFETRFALAASAATGTYSIELHTGDGKQMLTSRTIAVEEFVPDRIKVEAKLNRDQLMRGDKATLTLQANSMYGPPSANRNYEVELTLARDYFSAKGYDGYDFSLNDNTEFERIQRSGRTDAQGRAEESYTDLGKYNNIGVLEGRVYATVFDETNRPVNRVTRFTYFTQPAMLGIQYLDRYINPQTRMEIPLIAIDVKTQKVIAAEAKLQVVKLNWETVVERTGSRYRYTSKRREQIMADRTVSISDKGTRVEFIPPTSGEYEVRLYKPGANVYVKQEFYSYGYGYTQGSTFEVNPEGNVTIEADKENYERGEKANILFKTPFEGRLLVTYERGKVFGYQYLQTEKNAAKLSLAMDDEFVPNVYITATLIRPMGSGSLPLTVGHGFKSLTVENLDKKLPVEITAAENSTSRRKQTVTIKTKPGAEVTVAVVDEGILSIRNTQSPDPYKHFFAKQSLEVDPFDIYASLLPEISKGGSSKTGGDGYDLSRRVNPLTNKRFKLLAYWSGRGKADGSGQFTYTFALPQFAGAVRIMAVAYNGDAFGAAAKEMKVADPVVIATAMPRFLSPGDTIEVPVTLTNTTKQAVTGSTKINVNGSLKVLGTAARSVTLPAQGEARVTFRVAAAQGVGSGKVSLDVQASGSNYNETIDITVRPVSDLVKLNGSGTVQGGQQASIDLTAPGFIASSRQSKLVVSRAPVTQFARDLNYLLGYPHGCIEQTVSKVFPQLYYVDIVKLMLRKGKAQMLIDPSRDIQAGIGKIQSMQTSDGGVAYWPGQSESTPWGSVYAAHFLWEARKAGYEVNEGALDRLQTYLRGVVTSRTTEHYWLYTDNANWREGTYAAKHVLYGLFVLSLAGRPDVSSMNYYKSRPELLTQDSKYMLAAAYALAGDNASFTYLLPQGLTAVTRAETGGSFSSPIRDKGLALYTLLEADPRNSQVGALARQLSESMKKEPWLSTQEAVFGFLALGRFAQATAASKATGEVLSKGSSVGTVGNEDLELSSAVNGERVTLKAEGTGQLFYFWEVSGIETNGKVIESDDRLIVRKQFFSRNGTALSGRSFKQNELIVVKLTIRAEENESVENVVVSDLLPAGFEIENPRIADLPDIAWAKDADTPQYMDVRDDRIHFYTHVNGTREQQFYYVVRAVTPGRFRMGPASADCMYRADYHSTNGSGIIEVRSYDANDEQ